ncbi:MAG: hypothetical protein IT212_13260 [Bacteroidia bacterium]|nr:hypothetical protein [Bacteroidia bacterium]
MEQQQLAKQWTNDWMKLNEEQLKNVANKCVASGVSLNHSAISKLFNESPLLKTVEAQFCDIIILDIAKTIFGIVPESVEENLKISVFNAICERFNGITINDISIAFKTHVQQEKIYVLTRDEFIKPIQAYWTKKMIVKRELDAELEKVKEEQSKHDKIKDEYLKAKELYFESMGTGLYQGSVFQASMIMEAFAEHLSDEEKIEIGKQAIEDYREQVKLFGTEESIFYGTDVFQVPQGTGHYTNGKQKPKHHYFISMRVINNALQRQTVDGLGWKFIEG